MWSGALDRYDLLLLYPSNNITVIAHNQYTDIYSQTSIFIIYTLLLRIQDEKDSKPRYYSYGVPFFNYGFLPQTWEDVDHVDPSSGAKGDGDPIDVIEVGAGPLPMGKSKSMI